MKNNGRRRVIIEREITRDNVVQTLMEGLAIHNENREDIEELINIYKGKQKILERTNDEAGYSNVNNKVEINYAYSSVRDIVGYTFGKSTQYTATSNKYRRDVEEINRILCYEGNSLADHEAETYASICGVGYLCILPSEELLSDYMPDIPLIDRSLDPMTTFCIQSARIGNPTIMTVTYYTDGEETYFSCFTDKKIYYIVTHGNLSLTIGNDIRVKEVENIIGLNPIAMVQNNGFLMGDFEVAVSIFDAINQLASDTLNDVENVIKSLLIVINAEMTDDTVAQVKKNRILELIGAEGKEVDAKFIYQQLDALGMQNIREYLEEAYKQVIGIPDRKTRGGGGGDTGDAVKLRDGWADIEIVARIKEQYFKFAKNKQLAVAIEILKKLNLIGKNFMLKYIDIKVPRNTQDNLQTKAQAYSTLNGTKTLHPADSLDMVGITTDIDAKVDRGIKFWREQAEIEKNINSGNGNNINSSSNIKIGQEQKNQYNTDITETKVTKDNIKEEQQKDKRERIY